MKKSNSMFVFLGFALAIVILCVIGLATRKFGIQAMPMPMKGIIICVVGAILALTYGNRRELPANQSCARRVADPRMRVPMQDDHAARLAAGHFKAFY